MNQMNGTYESFHSVMEEHREEIDAHMIALANIFSRAGAGDRIDEMELRPYPKSRMIVINWDRRDNVVEGSAEELE